MKRMPASVFKARCLAVIRDVETSGEPVVVTKHGAPVVTVVPMKSKKDDLFGFMSGKFRIAGDIESPVWGK
jgi:prevent-host-death family protein